MCDEGVYYEPVNNPATGRRLPALSAGVVSSTLPLASSRRAPSRALIRLLCALTALGSQLSAHDPTSLCLTDVQRPALCPSRRQIFSSLSRLHLSSPSSMSAQVITPEVSFSADVRRLAFWADRAGLHLPSSAEALGMPYARAHRWFLECKRTLLQQGWCESATCDPRLLFSIEFPGPRTAAGVPRSPPVTL